MKDVEKFVAGWKERDRKNLEKAAEQMVPAAVGTKVIALLRERDEISCADLIASFEADAAARKGLGAMQVQACIKALRALKTDPAPAPADKEEA